MLVQQVLDVHIHVHQLCVPSVSCAHLCLQVDYATAAGRVNSFAAAVRTWVRLPHPRGGTPLRLALVDMYNMMNPVGRCIRAKDVPTAKWPWYPVQLSEVSGKLASAHPSGFHQGEVMFMRVHRSIPGSPEHDE